MVSFVIHIAWVSWCSGQALRLLCQWTDFRFDSHHANFTFFCLLFSGLRVTFTGQCQVRVSLAQDQGQVGIRLALAQGYVRVSYASGQLCSRLGLGLELWLGLGFQGLSFTFTSFLPSQLHSRLVLLLCHRWRMNKFSNFKIHRCIYSHCLQIIHFGV